MPNPDFDGEVKEIGNKKYHCKQTYDGIEKHTALAVFLTITDSIGCATRVPETGSMPIILFPITLTSKVLFFKL